MTDVSLEPEQGIAIADDRMTVVSLPAWLRLSPLEALSKRRWVRIRYSSGIFDPLTRPILRLRTRDGRVHYNFMNGAVLGSAEWIGRIPKNTVEAHISPTHHPGPFSFRIDRIQSINRLRLLTRGFFNNPSRTYSSISKRLTNSRQSSWELLKFVNASTPFSGYQQWHRRFSRALDLANFDRPRHDWNVGAGFVLLARLAESRPSHVRRTLATLQAQLYRNWRLFVLLEETATPNARAEFRAAARNDSRLQEIESLSACPPVAANSLVAAISFGDRLRDYALSSMAEAAIQHPEWQAIYSDEDSVSAGRLHSPVLKPDWSPALDRTSGYLGRLACLRAPLVAERTGPLLRDPEATASDILATLPPAAVGHVRRILYQRDRASGPTLVSAGAHPMPSAAAAKDWPGVAIVVPTRDRPELLDACIEGLTAMTDYPDLEVVVIDNGTTDPDALAMLAALRSDPRFKVIRDDGPFSYSRLCNAGAAAVGKPYVTFLNNDIVMLDRNWLKALISVCRKPNAGMVGAKLLFPDGRLQHAGVVLGLGGVAGHCYFKLREDDPGYLSELSATREVSAVTGACCAVERGKFLAVGGFDEVNLPIELNDIDLCLRLAEKGWQNYWTPDAILIHLQAASRGAADRPSDVYARERAYFLSRWEHVIRDDPHFHPALSLYAQWPALA